MAGAATFNDTSASRVASNFNQSAKKKRNSDNFFMITFGNDKAPVN